MGYVKTLCACGCGKPTKCASHTVNARGVQEGCPNRFLHGHHMRGERNNRYKGLDKLVAQHQGQHFCQCPRCLAKGACAETAIRMLPRHFGKRGIPKFKPRHIAVSTRHAGTGQHISDGLKAFYRRESPEHKQQRIETSRRNMGNWHQHFHRRPTGPELLMAKFLPSAIRYVGDGSFYCWIPSLRRNRNPDFKVAGQPKVIELFGDFWHRFDKPADIIAQYAEAGLACLVVWERELMDDPVDVIERCVRFMEAA